MKISDDGVRLIQRFEGFEGVVYDDAAGYATIGYGHLIRAGEDFSQGINRAAAELLLRQDIAIAERAVKRLVEVPLSQSQFDALVSFTFNLGAGALQRSTLRRKVNRAEHVQVPSEFLRWIWAGGRRLRGLLRRRQAEVAFYKNISY